jgi:HAE1 family hydrophobic/amphiphilic exporter-1
MFNIARFSVTRPVAVSMQIASLVLFGAICFTRLPVDLLPQVSIPTVSVSTNWPNVAPEELEAQVTRPLEEALSATPNMLQVSSTTSEGSSNVRVQFRWGTDIGQAAVDVMQLVERASRRFPNDPTLQKPLVFKYDPSQAPILVFGVSGPGSAVRLRSILENEVAPILESADGVASAVVTGGEQRAVIVDVDPVRLQAVGLTLNDLVRRIAAENVNLPAGIARQSQTEYTIRSLGWFRSPGEIAATPVGSFGGHIVSLGDVATVKDSHPETRLYTRLNGEPAAGIIISKQSGGNTVETAKAVFQKLEQAKRMYPELEFRLAYDQSRFIAASVRDVKNNALLGGILAILILLFFLRNLRSTLVVALSIPISIIATFGLLYVCGFTLNTMTLGGLALATGLIVDDAVVVLENIFRHIERDHKRAVDAAVSGTNEIGMAVLASTLTIIVVFLPLLLIRGQAGQMFAQFALVVIFAIAVSLLVAMTVVPMLSSRLISGEAHRELLESSGERNWLDRRFYQFGVWLAALDAAYRRGLVWALRHRWSVLGGAALASAVSFLLTPYIGREMMPQTDSGDFQVFIKLPVGTALERTNETMREVERIVLANPNVDTAFSAAGTTLSSRGNTTSLNPNQGSVTVKLKPGRRQSTLEVMSDIRRSLSRLAGVRPRVNQFDVVAQIMSGGNQNVHVTVFGNDISTLARLGAEVVSRVKDVPGYENVDVNWQEATPEVRWKIDRQKALQMGLGFSDVAGTISTATNGTITSYYHEGGFQYPIIVQVPEGQRRSVAALKNLVVNPSGSGAKGPAGILLRQIATPEYGVGPNQITRQDRKRYIAVTGQPQGRSAGEIQRDIRKALKDMTFPPGYYWDWGSGIKRQQEEFSGLGLAVLLAVGLVYMLLASQFESFAHPLTVILSVPLCAIGVILALFLSGRSFGLTAFVGLLMLVGIVVKNGILLVDYTNVLRSRGVARDEAVLEAGPTRLRPILMTASAAVLGMLPLALGLGEGSETQAPMATAVVGGLVTSTLLTLFVVPVVYTLLDDSARWLRRDRMDLAKAELVEPSPGAVDTVP